MKISFRFCLALMGAFLVCVPAMAQYKAAVRQLTTSDVYVALVKAIAEVTNSTIDTQVVPGARANLLIEGKEVSFFLPDIKPLLPAVSNALKFDYSTASIFPMAFVLYTNKNKPVDIADLKAGNKKGARIETDLSQKFVFEFKGMESTNIEGSLKKVDSGAIDGYIFSQATGDALLKKNSLKNVRRQLYGLFDMRFGIPKGPEGQAINKLLTDGMSALKATGKLDSIIGELAKASLYNDWQP